LLPLASYCFSTIWHPNGRTVTTSSRPTRLCYLATHVIPNPCRTRYSTLTILPLRRFPHCLCGFCMRFYRRSREQGPVAHRRIATAVLRSSAGWLVSRNQSQTVSERQCCIRKFLLLHITRRLQFLGSTLSRFSYTNNIPPVHPLSLALYCDWGRRMNHRLEA
jgi:hypothetical protein